MLQQTMDRKGNPGEIMIKGRHDPVIVPRAAVVVECMADLVIADALLGHIGDRSDKIYSFMKEV